MKEFTVIPKIFDKSYLKDNCNLIFKDRELITEKEVNGENVTLRFKLGDGHTPYKDLRYISSLYALYPNFYLCDSSYNGCINISFNETGVKQCLL